MKPKHTYKTRKRNTCRNEKSFGFSFTLDNLGLIFKAMKKFTRTIFIPYLKKLFIKTFIKGDAEFSEICLTYSLLGVAEVTFFKLAQFVSNLLANF